MLTRLKEFSHTHHLTVVTLNERRYGANPKEWVVPGGSDHIVMTRIDEEGEHRLFIPLHAIETVILSEVQES